MGCRPGCRYGAGRGEECAGMGDTLHSVRSLLGLGVEMLWQSVDLLAVKDRVSEWSLS
jgi:hypothetical protein